MFHHNIFYNLFSAYLRAVGNSQVPLFFLVFSACLNVVLDILFVVKIQMGVAGAAWATNLSQAISAVLCAVYIWVKVPDLKPEQKTLKDFYWFDYLRPKNKDDIYQVVKRRVEDAPVRSNKFKHEQ